MITGMVMTGWMAEMEAADRVTEEKIKAVKSVEKETTPMVMVKTTLGDIVLELDEKKAPVTVKNFLDYVDQKHYDGTIFHRVIDNFMIQGGGFTSDMNQKPTRAPIKNEADNGLKNEKGTVAMARTPAVDSATSQFFINVSDNAFLNHRDKTSQGYGYCVFGKVVKGLDVMDKIRSVKTGNRSGHGDVPLDVVEIISAERIQKSTGQEER